ncbi:MAG: DUF1772 domain-containing protein [Sulfitobacter sp.]
MSSLIRPLCLISLILTGALFGFFYAWVCSTMWGLDAADPRVAVAAMQAMNASVRNAVFAPAFFGTPIVLLITTLALFATAQRAAAPWFGAATAVVAALGFILTMAVNVPMNEALAGLTVPDDIETARAIWLDYSPDWQFWNQMRTIATGAGLLCVGIGIMQLNPQQ